MEDLGETVCGEGCSVEMYRQRHCGAEYPYIPFLPPASHHKSYKARPVTMAGDIYFLDLPLVSNTTLTHSALIKSRRKFHGCPVYRRVGNMLSDANSRMRIEYARGIGMP